ncbi:MAG: diguanylate cyclase/phosphodiesterase (GGDEF & EAL domains) with PAS/PAC sensor(s) [uncultured Rubrobacteraceae bacterium]|uniref:Diguanylate cyclase/phosphodiesterase (GGDEF & EAL domains) with PAS/PAC sensor(S) n=1 Tax=uncultured Rubrobacteraceae bacterium TaxID=349277 RepID=A0A6J4QDL9_9ACTN|nr:MAG: diguanylate cyclase/phosphodiesterase (GGDEF & EAL domains) with PAS/PAC sensor(s) [uncultured Rubrobacteraceae bacterium]
MPWDLAPVSQCLCTALAVVVAGLLLALLWALGRVRGQRDEHRRSDSLRDSLTDLPNRALFVERVESALLQAVRERGSIAVLLVDLDNFEEINHSMGHDAGDRLLVVISERLRESVGREGMVARLCSDEFAVLLKSIPDKNAAALVAEHIGDALKAPIGLDSNEVLVSATVGISLAGSDQDSPEGLLRKADVAMHAAKAQGKACYKVFDPDASTTTSGRLLLESEMRRAVREEECVVYYQPLVALETGEVRGMEALVRWQHPVYGLIPPGEFIPLAEQTGLIAPLGRWVLREACRQARLWHKEKQSSSSLMLSVNVSACQFRQPNLVEEVHRALKETGLDPRCLKLEITESVMMHDAAAIAALWELKGSGIELAMDDFGTGYSNLSYLKRLPIDTLKIDRSYISGLSHDAEDAAIVHATVAFARALNLNVTAEGIENAEQVARLQELGCELGQGYHFARPLPSNEATELLVAGLLR